MRGGLACDFGHNMAGKRPKKPRIEVLIEVGRSSRGDYKIPKRGSEVIVGNYDFLRDGRKFFLCQSLASFLKKHKTVPPGPNGPDWLLADHTPKILNTSTSNTHNTTMAPPRFHIMDRITGYYGITRSLRGNSR